jgi:hypothetical protein
MPLNSSLRIGSTMERKSVERMAAAAIVPSPVDEGTILTGWF